MEDLQGEYSFCEMSGLIKSDGNRMKFNINPEFGKGYQVLYKIIDGMYLIKTNYSYKNIKKAGYDAFNEDGVIFYKVLSGYGVIKLAGNKTLILSKDDIINFVGNGKVIDSYGEIKSVGIFCYYNKLRKSMLDLGLPVLALDKFYNNDKIRNILSYRDDISINNVLDDILKYMDDDNRLMLHAKSIELLNYALINFENHLAENKSKYRNEHVVVVEDIKNYLDNNLDKYYSMPVLAKKFGISLTYFKDIFKDRYGISPYRYHINRRLKKSTQLLLETDMKISEIACELGFSSSSKYTKMFKERYGLLPSQFKKSSIK